MSGLAFPCGPAKHPAVPHARTAQHAIKHRAGLMPEVIAGPRQRLAHADERLFVVHRPLGQHDLPSAQRITNEDCDDADDLDPGG